jgi:hypothetical protein
MRQVILKNNLEINKTYGGVRFNQHLNQFQGKTVNILDDCGQGIYRIQESIFTISEEMIENDLTEFEATITCRVKFHCSLSEGETNFVKQNFPGDFERHHNRGLYEKFENQLPFAEEIDFFESIKWTETK